MIQVLNGNDGGNALQPLANALSSLLRDLLYSPIMRPTGGEVPRGDPRPVGNPRDVLVHRFGDGPFSVSVEGFGALYAVGGPYYLQDLQGGVTVQYDFRIGDRHGPVVAIRLSPLYAEVAYLRAGVPENYNSFNYSHYGNLPFQSLFGVSGGIQVAQDLGPMGREWGQTGVRAFVRPLWNLDQVGTPEERIDFQAYAAVFTRIDLGRFLRADTGGALTLDAALEFVDRGGSWESLAYDGARPANQAWQGMLTLEWRP
jgi:hypothetical protein